MFSLLFDFFYNLFYMGYVETEYSSVLDSIMAYQPVIFGITFDDLGSYFAFIASIISLVAIVLFCVFIIKKIIGIIFRLFTGSSAF